MTSQSRRHATKPVDIGGRDRADRASMSIAALREPLREIVQSAEPLALLVIESPKGEGCPALDAVPVPPLFRDDECVGWSTHFRRHLDWSRANRLYVPRKLLGPKGRRDHPLMAVLARLGRAYVRYGPRIIGLNPEDHAGWADWANVVADLVSPDQRFAWHGRHKYSPLSEARVERVVQYTVFEDLATASLQAIDAIDVQAGKRLGPDDSEETDAVWVLDGAVWQIRFDGKQVLLGDSVNLRTVARLLSSPDTPIDAATLVGACLPTRAQDTLDDPAVREIREELRGLQGPPLTDERQVQIDRLLESSKRLIGPGGRLRRIADDVTKARDRARAHVRRTLAALKDVHPALHKHLAASIDTRDPLVYRPRPAPVWLLGPEASLP